jgi:hypothetical protein
VIRRLGFGPIPTDQPIGAGSRLVVRQPSAIGVGLFLDLIALGLAFGSLYDPGKTVGSGNGFIDRWFFGVIVVPALWGAQRFLLRPRILLDDTGVRFENPMHTIEASWAAVQGAGYDTALRLSLADGDSVGATVFGQALSSPLTRRDRVEELARIINQESARRSGRTYDPEAAYSAESLVGSVQSSAPKPDGPGATHRPAYGLVSLAVYAAAWTLSCVLAAIAS